MLTRAETRAEIHARKKGTTLTTEQLLAYLAALPREELLGLVATLRARREAPATPTTTPAAPTTRCSRSSNSAGCVITARGSTRATAESTPPLRPTAAASGAALSRRRAA